MTATSGQPATPVPQQSASLMAPVGQPAAAHVGPPAGIPSGPSNQELMLLIQQQGKILADLQARGISFEALEEEAAPVMKRYFHQTPGSNIVVTDRGPTGEHIPRVVHFDHHGELESNDPVVQAFLDPIVNKPGVPIYTKAAPQEDPAMKQMAEEVKSIASETIVKLGPEAQKTPI
jgi:hypothetical protein